MVVVVLEFLWVYVLRVSRFEMSWVKLVLVWFVGVIILIFLIVYEFLRRFIVVDGMGYRLCVL